MVTNVGSADRLIRIVVGIVLIFSAVFPAELPLFGSYSWVGWIGVVPLVTGLLAWCPAYSLFGIDTCKIDTRV